MYSTADYSVTPRPMYPADGRKLPGRLHDPGRSARRTAARARHVPALRVLGTAPSIESTSWIAESAKHVEQKFKPTLTLVYLPHLDYNLQRVGPGDPAAATDVRQVDEVCGDLIAFYEAAGVQVAILSEYGLVRRRRRRCTSIACCGSRDSSPFATSSASSCSIPAPARRLPSPTIRSRTSTSTIRRGCTRCATLLERTPGVEQVLDSEGKARTSHQPPACRRSRRDLRRRTAWFTYYYWLDDERAPDFARTVDIHRKPGYDPVELFLDPAIRMPALTVGWKLARKALGFRMLMDVIPLDATLVKGSHGRPGLAGPDDGPVFLSKQKSLLPGPSSIRSASTRSSWLTLESNMAAEQEFLSEIERSVQSASWDDALGRILTKFSADSGTIHMLGDDGVLHLKAASAGIPPGRARHDQERPGRKRDGRTRRRAKAAGRCLQHTDGRDWRCAARCAGHRASGIDCGAHAARRRRRRGPRRRESARAHVHGR